MTVPAASPRTPRTLPHRTAPERQRPMLRTLSLTALLLALAAGATPSHAEDAPTEKKKHGLKATEALAVVERHAVLVSLKFQKDLEAEEHGAVAPDTNSVSERFRLWRMSYVVPGFVVKDRRTVLISDVWVSPGAVASVSVRPLTGTPVVARLRGFLRRAEAVVIETESDLPVEPVPFATESGAEAPEAALAGSVAEGARGVESWVDGLGTVRRRVGSAKLAFGAVDAPTNGLSNDHGSRTVDLVLGAGATPIGLRFGGGMDVDDGIWRGPDVLRDAEIPFPSLQERATALAASGTRARVEVVLRTTKRDDSEDQPYHRYDSGGEGKSEHWGFAVAPDLLVVPARIEPDAVRRIESVRWKVDDGPGKEAQYAGKVRDYDAFLVRVPGATFQPLPEAQPKVPGIGDAVLVHRTAWRGGERRDQVDYNRVLGWGRRYADRMHWALEREVDEGALLLDLDGKVLGFAARIDPEDKEQRLDESSGYYRRNRREFPLMAVLFQEVGAPSTLAKDPDTRVMPQEETQSKRLPWFGVESTGFGKVVAEMLDISAPTRDGARGLLVGRVYPGSPAAKAGIEVGDILLTARRTSGPGSDAPPVDLEEGGGGGWYSWRSFMDWGGEDAPQPWKSQDTALHRLLKGWGEGTSYEIQFLRKRETKTATFQVEWSPPTYDSAEKKKDDGTGLTVRDLTYEVRAGLRLSADAPGVVVARVEPGSPAAQTRIGKNELIQEVEGKHVVDVGTFEALLEEARSQGKENVRVVVRRLDKTRLVDLGLAPKDLPREDKPGEPAVAPADAPVNQPPR